MNSAAREGWLERRETAEGLVLSLGGRWDMRCAERHEKELRQLTTSGGQALHIDFADLQSLDTAGAWLVHRLAKRLRSERIAVAFDNLPAAHADILERLDQIDSHVEIEPPRPNAIAAITARVGKATIYICAEILESIAFLGLTVVTLVHALVRPKHLRVSAIFYHMEQAGLNAIPITR